MSPIDQYKTALNSHTHGVGRNHVTWDKLVSWYLSSGRDLFIDCFEKETQLQIRAVNRKDGALVEQGFPKNINEYDTKVAWDQYYVSNGLIALKEIDRLVKSYPPSTTKVPEIMYVNGIGLVRHLLLDTLILIDDWATFKQHLPGLMGVGKNRYEHALAIYHSALQVVYGNCSPLSFSDNHSDTSINQLRMAIEVRLRRGFGIVAKQNLSGALVPLPLSEVIAAIKQHRASIMFSVPFEHVERLYGWANIYMHAGFKQYAWSPVYALHYLRPFILGGAYAGGTSVHAGVRTKYGVVKQVQASVEALIDKKRHSLWVDDPKDCDIILTP